jgi:type II secretory pathway component PulM
MIKQKWEQLSSRDQTTLKLGAIFLISFLVLRGIWWPLFHQISVLKEAVAEEQSLIQWMAPRVAQLLEAKKSGLGKKKDKSLATFQKSLQQVGLKPYLTEFSQNAQGQVTLVFASVPFESCMEWLAQVQRQGWVLRELSAERGQKSGLVQLTLVLG